MSEETKGKMSRAALGCKKSAETRAKMAAVARARAFSPETRAKFSAAAKRTKRFLGHKHTPEALLKMGAASREFMPRVWMKRRIATIERQYPQGIHTAPASVQDRYKRLKAELQDALQEQEEIREQMRQQKK